MATVNLTARSSPFIEFENPPGVHLKPPAPSTVTVHLANSGTADAVLALSTAVPEGWWANLSQANILIPSWGSEDVPVALTAPAGTPAGTLAFLNLTAAAGAYVNSTSIPVTVDQVFGAALEDCSTASEVLPGAQYDYRFTLRNTGNGPDDIDLELAEGEGGEGWTASLDRPKARLAAGETVAATVAVTAPPAAAAGAQWTVRLSVRHSNREASAFDIVSTVARLRSLTLSTATAARSGDPGETLRFTLGAANAGNAGESVLFKAPKQDGLLLELGEPDYSFQPAERIELPLTSRIQPGAAGGVRVFNITAAARDDPAVNATLELRVTVNPHFAGELVFPQTRQEAPAGGTAVFRCTLYNRGNTKDTFTVARISGTTAVRIDPATVTLAPGAGAVINITASIPGEDAGGERAFKVAVRSLGKSAEVAQKELTVDVPLKPAGGGGTPAVAVLAAGAAVIAAAVAAVFVLRRRKRSRSA
jgi:uncharacterized membrane protein